MLTPTIVADIATQCKRLLPEGAVTELRIIDKLGRITAGYFDNSDALAKAAASQEQAQGVYFVFNEINPDLLARANNRLVPGLKTLTRDSDITSIRYLPVDIDAERPAGISATHTEHETALAAARSIRDYLVQNIGVPANAVILGDSGNGAHIMVRCDMPPGDASRDIINRCLKGLAAKFDTDDVHVDTSVGNQARIWKLPGTWARKGDSTEDRPHRQARLIEVPDTLIATPKETLQKLAELAPVEPETRKDNGQRPISELFDLEGWLSKHGIEVKSAVPYRGGTRYIINQCPFVENHGARSDVAVFQGADGQLGFKCQHPSCQNMHWQDFRKHYEPEYNAGPPSNGNLPSIVVSDRQMPEITEEVMTALEQANHPPRIFVRGGALTRISTDEDGRPIAADLKHDHVRHHAGRVATYYTKNGKNYTNCPVPDYVVKDLMSYPSWQFPALRAIVESPVVRPDGTILDTPGYDPQSRLYYAPTKGLDLPPVPEVPTTEDSAHALERLVDIIADFPFDNEASKTNALAAILTPLARPMIAGKVPMCLITKPQVGTGASMLAELIALLATGRAAAMTTVPKDEESWRKQVTSILVRAQTIAVVDNVEGILYSPVLALILTAETFTDRILGRTEMIELPHRIVWIATGNNVKLGGDLPRRAYQVRMDSLEARPWLRPKSAFRHPDLPGYVANHRGALLAAGLILIRAWVAAGRPEAPGLPSLGGFEIWVQTIGGILHHAGVGEFLDNLSEMYDTADVETPQWEAFFTALYERQQSAPFTSKELAKRIEHDEDLENLTPDRVRVKRDRDGKLVPGFTHSLGKMLSARAGRRYPNGLLFQQQGTAKNAVKWQLVPPQGEFGTERVSLADESARHGPHTGVSLGEFSPLADSLGEKTPHSKVSGTKLTQTNPHAYAAPSASKNKTNPTIGARKSTELPQYKINKSNTATPEGVTNVTFHPQSAETSPGNTHARESFGKTAKKSNISNTDLPQYNCPACGKFEWGFNAEGAVVCTRCHPEYAAG